MDQTRRLTVFALLAVVACDDHEPSPSQGRDSSVDGATPSLDGSTTRGTLQNDTGVECCTPSPAPACCMSFGGAKSQRGFCGSACDGMPGPSDPAWRLVSDAFGCPTWTSKGSTGPCCGSKPPPPDASTPHNYMCYPDPVPIPD